MPEDFLDLTKKYIATWHGIHVPNEAASRMAADLANVIKAFETQRGRLRFEDEPSSFEAALQATKAKAATE